MIRLIFVLSFLLLYVIPSQSQTNTSTDSVNSIKGVLDTPVNFSGWQGAEKKELSLNEIRIGLFLPTNTKSDYHQSLINAAILATEEINLTGGYNGIPYKLVKRWSNDPWGSGSKEMINLVYKDSVWAIIGSIDGDATHVAEQIVTKAWLPLLSPISADPTLTYIRIPWIFRLPPDFKTQSEVLLNKGIRSDRLQNIGLITDNSHDGRIFANEMTGLFKVKKHTLSFHFELSQSDLDIRSIVERAIAFEPKSIIIYSSKEYIIKFVKILEAYKMNIDLLLPWIPGLNSRSIAINYDDHLQYLEPFSRSSNPLYEEFAENYRASFQTDPTFGAAYVYDAVKILTIALKNSGLNRAKLRDAIANIKDYQGVTGKITWDNGGGNTSRPILRVVRKQKRNQE